MTYHQILYLSRLAPGYRHDVYGAICQRSRRRNAEIGVTGVLLFDGERFCQLIEGPAEPTRALMALIASDLRHDEVRMVLDRPSSRAPASRLWMSGYCEPEALDVLDSTGAPQGNDALAVFLDIAGRADLSL